MSLTSQQLAAAGIKPGPLFGKCLRLNTIEEALEFVAANTKPEEPKQSVRLEQGTVWFWFCKHPCLQNMCSIETKGAIASNSEKRRWLESRSVLINGRTDWSPDELVPISIVGLVFFPASTKKKITML